MARRLTAEEREDFHAVMDGLWNFCSHEGIVPVVVFCKDIWDENGTLCARWVPGLVDWEDAAEALEALAAAIRLVGETGHYDTPEEGGGLCDPSAN